MFEAFKNVSVKEILEYYALISLILTPLFAIITFYLSRKTHLLDWLYRLADGKKNKTEEQGEELSEELIAFLKEKESLRESHIAEFNIMRGENYSCRLIAKSRTGDRSLYKRNWYSDNAFIGKVSQDGLFEARHTGFVRILNKITGEVNDPGTDTYHITVLPSTKEWDLQSIYECVAQRIKKGDVLEANLGRKITAWYDKDTIVEYGPKGNQKRMVLQFNVTGELNRAVMALKKLSQSDVEALINQLNERMEEVRLKTTGIRIWIHRQVTHEYDEVDHYCWIKRLDKEDLTVLAIGTIWRENSDIEEFMANLRMAERVFSECVPEYVTFSNEKIEGEVDVYDIPSPEISVEEDDNETYTQTENSPKTISDESKQRQETHNDGPEGEITKDDMPDINEAPEQENDQNEDEQTGEENGDQGNEQQEIDFNTDSVIDAFDGMPNMND